MDVLLNDEDPDGDALVVTAGTYVERIDFRGKAITVDGSAAATPPVDPSGLSATAASHERIDLAWFDNSGDETAFHIERSPDGSGWAVSAAWKLNDKYFPFVRFGHSDGGGGVAAETAVSGGVEISRPRGEVWTIGAGWAKPSEETFGPGLDNETVLEMSYKFPISKNFSVLPDAQIIFSPANNPGRTSIWVIGIRAILTL